MSQTGKRVVCSKCKSALKPIGNVLNDLQSSGWVTAGFSEANKQGWEQWLGTTCMQCHMVFCEKCRDVGPGKCPNCGGEIRPAQAAWLPKNAGRIALRILIAHSGETLESQDANEILKYAWDGQFSKNMRITSNPLTPTAWNSNENLAYSWCMWQQMLQHKYGEQPFWDNYETFTWGGTIARTGQRFRIQIYYSESETV